jgi:SAM-dependent methyltransferase
VTTAASVREVAYPGKPYVQTHPDRLAVIARLFGRGTQDVAACRMLEIGCGDGTNLIGMASILPGAEFVGVDLSASSIESGKQLARQAGVKNVTLLAMDLCDFADGEFDYIVAHGVYSWVPVPVRDALLRVCTQRLAKNGVAMISYAAYPGGYIEQLVRAPMRFHARGFDDPKEKFDAARSFASTVMQHSRSPALRALFTEELGRIPPGDAFFLHDQLGEIYNPSYFTEFVEHAASHGLRYLALGTAGVDLDALPEVRKFAGGDRIAAEQYLDFLRCRRFRQTILCRDDVSVSSAPDSSALQGCHAAAPVYLSGEKTGEPALDAAWPGFVPCCQLRANGALLELFAAGKIDVRTVPPSLDDGSAARPRATALARAQAEAGAPLTNLLHHEVKIEDAFTRKLVTMLDGRRTRAELIKQAGPDIDRILKMLANHALLRA